MTALEVAPVGGSSSAWSAEELRAIREGLQRAVDRLRLEIQTVGTEMSLAVRQSTVEVHDDLDVASRRVELLQDAVQAENASAILAQTEHVLSRLDAGLYGTCESCSGQIARARLEAFPRATLCMSCVR